MSAPQCRDFFNDDAEIWESALLRCAHCRHEWFGIFLIVSLNCPHCHRTTRKKVIGDL